MASIKKDFKMLLKAKEDADEFINMLFTFESNPEYQPIINELKKINLFLVRLRILFLFLLH